MVTRTLRHITPGATVPLARPPRAAATGRPADLAAPARDGSPRSSVSHVADFYGAYTDALHDVGRGQLADVLRRHYLTPELRRELDRWETLHHQDGVLRAADLPVAWSVAYGDSGMGHCWSRVTLTWEEPGHAVRHTRLRIRSDLATRLISGIWPDE
jgi:hypothetical protein